MDLGRESRKRAVLDANVLVGAERRRLLLGVSLSGRHKVEKALTTHVAVIRARDKFVLLQSARLGERH
jgi:hypothetical protein